MILELDGRRADGAEPRTLVPNSQAVGQSAAGHAIADLPRRVAVAFGTGPEFGIERVEWNGEPAVDWIDPCLSSAGGPEEEEGCGQRPRRPHRRISRPAPCPGTTAKGGTVVEQGENLEQVSAVLGHSRIGTTGNIYGHYVETLDRRAAERLEAALLEPGDDLVETPLMSKGDVKAVPA